MGLDVTAYEFIHAQADPVDDDEAYEAGCFSVHNNGEFKAQADGCEGWFRPRGREFDFRAGSYSGYNEWRDLLSKVLIGVEAQGVWNNPDKYRGQPFFELVNFSDCEGFIGPLTCAKLARDFEDHRDRFAAHPDVVDHHRRGLGSAERVYECFARAFKLAAGTGGVQFH